MLWNNDGKLGVRIEAPSILREFSNNIAFGTDPPGYLFFDDLDDLGTLAEPGSAYFNVLHNTNVAATQQALVIQFFFKTQGSFFAEFIAKDPRSIAQKILVDGASAPQGTWKVLDASTTTARIKKPKSETEIIIEMKSIGKKVSYTVPSAFAGQVASIKAAGTLTFQNLSKLKAGTKSYVDHNNDRILFYPQRNYSDELTAVFLLIETTDMKINALGDYTFTATTPIATWSDI